MIAEHELVVAARFDALHDRFKGSLASDDPRLRGVIERLGPVRGRRVLDLGCGKGRFSRALAAQGATVIGLDLSAAMLDGAAGVDRVRASARRLPFGPASFDAVMAVEVFEHLPPRSVDDVCLEIRRVLRPGGTLVIVDKNVCSWNARGGGCRPRRSSGLTNAAVSGCIPIAIEFVSTGSGPVSYERAWAGGFGAVRVDYLLSHAERGRFPFEHLPGTRLFLLWAAQAPGGET